MASATSGTALVRRSDSVTMSSTDLFGERLPQGVLEKRVLKGPKVREIYEKVISIL